MVSISEMKNKDFFHYNDKEFCKIHILLDCERHWEVFPYISSNIKSSNFSLFRAEIESESNSTLFRRLIIVPYYKSVMNTFLYWLSITSLRAIKNKKTNVLSTILSSYQSSLFFSEHHRGQKQHIWFSAIIWIESNRIWINIFLSVSVSGSEFMIKLIRRNIHMVVVSCY